MKQVEINKKKNMKSFELELDILILDIILM